MKINFPVLVESFSLIGFSFDSASMKRMQRDLAQSALSLDARKYSSFCFSSAIAIALLSFFLSAAFAGLTASVSTAVLAFVLCLSFLLYLPWFLKKRRAAEIERDLPLFLRSAAVDLQLNAPFEKMLESASEGYGVLSGEIRKIVGEIRAGYPVQYALSNFASRVDSLSVKRSAMQLVFSYEHGFDAHALRKLADELIQQQRIKSREFAAKQAFFGLLFIAASTIVPALFSAYVMIGSSFLSLTFSSQDIVVFFAFVFPLVDFTILFYLSEAKPKVL